MKYEIEFINKLQDGVNRNCILTFGEHDVKTIALLCFEYAQSGAYQGLKVVPVRSDKDKSIDRKYSDIYRQALCELHLTGNDVEDYRPADPLFIPELKQPIPGAIILWLKSGEKIIYFDNK